MLDFRMTRYRIL